MTIPIRQEKGYEYPFRVVGGRLATVTDAQLKRCHIYHLIETELYENPMRADYGTNAPLFEASRFDEYRIKLESQLRKYISKCTFVISSEGITEEGEYKIDIYWSYNGVTQDPINFLIGN